MGLVRGAAERPTAALAIEFMEFGQSLGHRNRHVLLEVRPGWSRLEERFTCGMCRLLDSGRESRRRGSGTVTGFESRQPLIQIEQALFVGEQGAAFPQLRPAGGLGHEGLRVKGMRTAAQEGRSGDSR
jgi:hypothetical protein